MLTFGGMQIVVSRPAITIVKRGFFERLFSLHPFQKTKTKVNPAAIPPDQCYKIGNQLHCGELFYEQLKKSAELTSASSCNF